MQKLSFALENLGKKLATWRSVVEKRAASKLPAGSAKQAEAGLKHAEKRGKCWKPIL